MIAIWRSLLRLDSPRILEGALSRDYRNVPGTGMIDSVDRHGMPIMPNLQTHPVHLGLGATAVPQLVFIGTCITAGLGTEIRPR